jgi:hypothetical protein
MTFPINPSTGKGGKVFMNISDGVPLSAATMTKQATYIHKGETFTNRVYLLGTGKTLINQRPAVGVAPQAFINSIVDGLTLSPGASDKIAVAAGRTIIAGVETAVVANTAVAITRPAATQGAWVTISVDSAGTFTATKGTDTTAGTGIAALLDTYGVAAGERPLIPLGDLLVGHLKLTNGAAVVLATEIFYYDREIAAPYTLLPNIGGIKLNTALVACHAGTLGRPVTFSGYYTDDVLSEIGSAKSWTLTPSANTVTETTLGNTYSVTEIGAWAFTFEQLAISTEALNNLISRQGYAAVRLQYPNGGYFQGSCSMVPTFNNAAGAFCNITVSGSFQDDPVFS